MVIMSAAQIPLKSNTGRFAILRQLLADGITSMFGNPGSTEESLIDALQADEFRNLKYYLALHEGTAVAMADSYARATKRPAIVQLHSYAGLANGLGMIYYARRGYTPMVVLVGEAGLRYDAMDGQMAADLVTMARPFVKADYNGPCAWRVVDRRSVLRLLRRAIKAASTPPTGPVLLVLPMDVLDEENVEPIVPSVSIRSADTPDVRAIKHAAELLAQASRPLILMGDGIAASEAQSDLVHVAELVGAVVWGANSSEVNMPASHALFAGDLGHMFGEESKPITAAADVILVCGTTVLPEVFPSLDNIFAPDASVIHFDLNTYEIAKNFPVTIGSLGDPKSTLSTLAQSLEMIMTSSQRGRAKDRADVARARKAKEHQGKLAYDASVRDCEPLRMSRFAEELALRLPTDALIFDEALTCSPDLCRYLVRDTPGTYFQTRAGMLGTGLPGALGLKLAHPNKVVFGFSGDGGSISTIQAIATAARHNIGAKFVVCNNSSYRILKYGLRQYRKELKESSERPFPKEFDLVTPELRFDQLARAQGVDAVRVEHVADIASAIDRAFANDYPLLIDLLLSPDL